MGKLKLGFKLLLATTIAASIFLLINTFGLFRSEVAGFDNVGRAPFALTSKEFVNKRCDNFIRSMRGVKNLHIAFLYNTFGNDFRCLNRLLKDERLRTIQANILNEPGHRNRRLGSYEFLKRFSSPAAWESALKNNDQKTRIAFLEHVQPLQEILMSRKREDTECLINVGLESNVRDPRAINVMMKWGREAFPMCRMVWNPLKATSSVKGTTADLIEQHGANPKVNAPCIVNPDGTDINFPGTRNTVFWDGKDTTPKNFINYGRPLQQYIETYANRCEVVYLWMAEDNLINQVSFLDPRKRKVTAKHSQLDELLGKAIRQAQNKGKPAPAEIIWTETDNRSLAGCSSVKSPKENPVDGFDGFKIGFTYKQSEFDDRGIALLLPRGQRARSVEVSKNGSKIESLRYTGDFHGDGRQVWRANVSPLQLGFKYVMRVRTDKELICYKLPNARIRYD